jgi:hypothetical protein
MARKSKQPPFNGVYFDVPAELRENMDDPITDDPANDQILGFAGVDRLARRLRVVSNESECNSE